MRKFYIVVKYYLCMGKLYQPFSVIKGPTKVPEKGFWVMLIADGGLVGTWSVVFSPITNKMPSIRDLRDWYRFGHHPSYEISQVPNTTLATDFYADILELSEEELKKKYPKMYSTKQYVTAKHKDPTPLVEKAKRRYKNG